MSLPTLSWSLCLCTAVSQGSDRSGGCRWCQGLQDEVLRMPSPPGCPLLRSRPLQISPCYRRPRECPSTCSSRSTDQIHSSLATQHVQLQLEPSCLEWSLELDITRRRTSCPFTCEKVRCSCRRAKYTCMTSARKWLANKQTNSQPKYSHPILSSTDCHDRTFSKRILLGHPHVSAIVLVQATSQ